MKKLIVLAVALAAVFCLASCSGMVTVGAFKSNIYTQEEFDEAVAVVQEYFKDFEGCTMKEIAYAGDEAAEAEAEAQGMDFNQVIVLTSKFETDSEDHENGLEPDTTYEDYKWILTRSDTGAPWEHKDHGYG